ncbi:MAG: Imm10 family immunity protein [Microcoleus sp.]
MNWFIRTYLLDFLENRYKWFQRKVKSVAGEVPVKIAHQNKWIKFMMVFELFAKLVGIEESFYIGFSSGEDNEHYFVMQRHEFHKEDALPNLESVYWEIDDEGWGEYGGIKEVTLNRERLIVRFDPSRPNAHQDCDEAKIAFSVNDSEFQKLQNTLQKIMLGYEDRLNLIN